MALSAIAKRAPNSLHGIAGNVWNRIVFKGWNPVDPRQLTVYFQKLDLTLHLAIANLIGEEVIRDIYYVRSWRGAKKTSTLVVELAAGGAGISNRSAIRWRNIYGSGAAFTT